jgi:hypothetical protein
MAIAIKPNGINKLNSFFTDLLLEVASQGEQRGGPARDDRMNNA